MVVVRGRVIVAAVAVVCVKARGVRELYFVSKKMYSCIVGPFPTAALPCEEPPAGSATPPSAV